MLVGGAFCYIFGWLFFGAEFAKHLTPAELITAWSVWAYSIAWLEDLA